LPAVWIAENWISVLVYTGGGAAVLPGLPGRREDSIQAEEAEEQHANEDDCNEGGVKAGIGSGSEQVRPHAKILSCLNVG
jgi:hypothetical protein